MISIYLKYLVIFCIIMVLGSCQEADKKSDEPGSKREDINKILEESNKILLSIEDQEIDDFVERHNLDVKETGSGLRYSIKERGDGPKAKTGMTAVLEYRVRLLTGDVVYDSEEDGLKEFEIGRGGVESGLEEGILLLREGDKAIFIMPAHLAHGVPGDGEKIPKKAGIVYDVELTALK